MEPDPADNEHPLAEVAFQLGRAFPTVALDNVIAAVRQASEELVASGDPAQVFERARLILRAGLERRN